MSKLYTQSTLSCVSDINECLTGKYKCELESTTCSNNGGSYNCQCKDGYKPGQSMYQCQGKIGYRHIKLSHNGNLISKPAFNFLKLFSDFIQPPATEIKSGSDLFSLE